MKREYKGLEYIVYPHMGSYCGYVKLPEGHPFCKFFRVKKIFGRDIEVGYDDMDIECHGGLTFSRKIENEDCPQEFSNGYWIGWDYLHLFDAWDLPIGESIKGKRWSEEEVEKECKDVIEQVLKRNSVAV